MREQEWAESEDPAAMIRHLTHHPDNADPPMFAGQQRRAPLASDRKLRLWVEACRAGGSGLYDLDLPRGLEQAIRDWASFRADNSVSLPLAARADLLRHVVGNPFRPPVTKECEHCKGVVGCSWCHGNRWLPVPLPDHWPGAVVELARACVAVCKCEGTGWMDSAGRPRMPHATSQQWFACSDCNGQPQKPPYFALHDALLDAGCPELASHFRGRHADCFVCNRCPVGEACPHCVDGIYAESTDGKQLTCDACGATGKVGGSHPKGCWAIDLILGLS